MWHFSRNVCVHKMHRMMRLLQRGSIPLGRSLDRKKTFCCPAHSTEFRNPRKKYTEIHIFFAKKTTGGHPPKTSKIYGSRLIFFNPVWAPDWLLAGPLAVPKGGLWQCRNPPILKAHWERGALRLENPLGVFDAMSVVVWTLWNLAGVQHWAQEDRADRSTGGGGFGTTFLTAVASKQFLQCIFTQLHTIQKTRNVNINIC